MRFVKALCCAAAMVVCLAPGVGADEWNKKTILTFSGPVQIPGATLAAGTYVFKLADVASNRHVVQVFDKDEKKIYATILAIPDQKLEPSDKPVVMFAERPAGVPQAVKAWFYPGETIGNEFVYPKDQALRIARETRTAVLSMDDTDTATTTEEQRRDAMKSATVTRVDESGTTTATTTTAASTTTTATTTTTTAPAEPVAPAPPRRPDEPETTTAELAPPPTVTVPSPDAQLKDSSGNVPMAVGTSGELPRTGSGMGLIGLLGGLAFAAGFGVRRIRTRLASTR